MRVIYKLENVDTIAKEIINNVKSKTIFFYGNMGTGKTTLIKSIVKCLGSKDEVSSPTFSIVNEYETENQIIYHFDLYRINDLEEAYNFGIEDYLFSNKWILIEWPELIEHIVPEHDSINITLRDDNSRILELKCKPNLTEKTC
ncbi:tRNA (adenosine(37)-N6)-threonylcarbamoyltransferase complex ATPase subunit type 1 TsaE [Seonamhaeicola sediminis]|uniref:tRNA threonylcarbamoyladenosine biosynthesis protein TsaE n=1 Tax=Seonamhaeicola sediminis TaxID=2528206 RepID=A0A562YEI3_9FLAO|nr:tRNA (adenosine(37)-N6)-threonylcarbamoyltransferase complex ATPase subunit type 1 TsaE [Seonamhaeicola sediminis]TWO33035.1 tRNA (adenosine(37)-N6)-threonylcarbamoyltransferase complex ATPase subunit type 1 TsaE [Seonamhaeicola sediminis]